MPKAMSEERMGELQREGKAGPSSSPFGSEYATMVSNLRIHEIKQHVEWVAGSCRGVERAIEDKVPDGWVPGDRIDQLHARNDELDRHVAAFGMAIGPDEQLTASGVENPFVTLHEVVLAVAVSANAAMHAAAKIVANVPEKWRDAFRKEFANPFANIEDAVSALLFDAQWILTLARRIQEAAEKSETLSEAERARRYRVRRKYKVKRAQVHYHPADVRVLERLGLVREGAGDEDIADALDAFLTSALAAASVESFPWDIQGVPADGSRARFDGVLNRIQGLAKIYLEKTDA